MQERKALAENLKRIRKKLKISQIEFAAGCGISTETLSLLERQLSDPKLSTLQKIARYADCKTVDLLKNNK